MIVSKVGGKPMPGALSISILIEARWPIPQPCASGLRTTNIPLQYLNFLYSKKQSVYRFKQAV